MRLNLGLIFAGLIFFFNPSFNLFDILPDFIGALLIMLGLSKMYVFDANLEDARRNAKFLLWISVLRLVLCVWTVGGHRDYVMPFTFIICVLEAIYMLGLFRNLYLGMEYTLMRSDCEGNVKRVNEAFTMSFIFVIVSRALEFAPHITDILKQDAELDLSSGASFKMPMAQMKMYILGACLICSLILGIFYVFMTARAFIGVIKEKNYSNFLSKKYEDYLVLDWEKHVYSRLSLSYFLLTLSPLFLIDFYIDGINIIPTPLAALLAFSAFVTVKHITGQKANARIFIPALVSSVLSYLYMTRVQLGINHLCFPLSYNKLSFPLLADKSSVIYAAFFAIVEAILIYGIFLQCLNAKRELFDAEKRRGALGLMRFTKIPALLLCLCSAALKILTTFKGYLSHDKGVLDYIKNKAFILNEQNYKTFMENPLIVRYEKVTSACFILAAVTVVLALSVSVLLIRTRGVSEGEQK